MNGLPEAGGQAVILANFFQRTWALLTAVTAIVIALGCAPSGGGDGKIKIGFLVKQPEEVWFQ